MGKALPTRQKRHVKQIPKMEEWSKNQPDRQKDNCQTSSTRMAKESVLYSLYSLIPLIFSLIFA